MILLVSVDDVVCLPVADSLELLEELRRKLNLLHPIVDRCHLFSIGIQGTFHLIYGLSPQGLSFPTYLFPILGI